MPSDGENGSPPKRPKVSEENDLKPLTKDFNKNSIPQTECFKVGSRKSELALIQTNWVINELKGLFPTYSFEVITMTTIGDRILNQALSKIGEKNLFTKELEIALEKEEVHFVVHSLKDLPTTLPDGMVIGAVCKREDPSDAVVLKKGIEGSSLKDLRKGSLVGTSSVRRVAQLTKLHPNLHFKSIRGNLNTRLRKLDEENEYSAIILAAAGLKRMGWENRISQLLPSKQCLHAVGQGALAVECRSQDTKTLDLLSKLSNEKTSLQCVAERAFMKRLGGGCSAPVAVFTKLDEDYNLEMTGGVFSLDGEKSLIHTRNINIDFNENSISNGNLATNSNHGCYSSVASSESVKSSKLFKAEEFGTDLADELIKQGAKAILDEARLLNSPST